MGLLKIQQKSIDDFLFQLYYFIELKAVKWDKKASKLFEKILSVQFDILSLVITKVFSNIRKIFGIYCFTLNMLTDCSVC